MENRNASGKFPNMDSTTQAWITDNATKNETYYTRNLRCIDSMPIILHSLKAGIGMVGLAGNAIVLWLLNFHIQRNAFSVYVLNLAGADLLFLSFLTVHSLGYILFHFSDVHIDIFFYLITVFIFAYLADMFIIAAISAERCLSVLWPIWYRCRRPRHLSTVICALLWAFSLLLSTLLWHRRFKRQTLKVLLQRAMQDTPEEEGEERGSSRNPGEQETVLYNS